MKKYLLIPQVRIVDVNYDQIKQIKKDIYEDYEQLYLHMLLYLPKIFHFIKRNFSNIYI